MALRQALSLSFLSLALWQPLWEELLFRGVLQGQLGRHSWGQHACCGMTTANGITSLLFALGHFWRHPPLWALAVLAPSLLFGYVRDRHTSVYPAIALHALYNASYFWLTGLP
ncbi:MAG: JDVT-CTERM system CAAX-type protease [Nitrospinae bacterium]|nr:JDVT-CTERM system CAAX-type protease [Nitrospinota bacterium]